MKFQASFSFSVIVLLLTVMKQSISMKSQLRTKSDNVNMDTSRCPNAKEMPSLDSRSSSSDVILTGTIIRLQPERYLPSTKSRHSKVPTGNRMSAQRSNLTVTGHVKVWHVMKGSINDILPEKSRMRRRSTKKKRTQSNSKSFDTFTRGGRDLSGEADSSSMVYQFDPITKIGGQKQPILEIHGLWNSYLCGSFLKEGDTRVFFLKKMADHREPELRRRRSSSGRRVRRRRKRKTGKNKKNKRSKKNKQNKKKHRKNNKNNKKRKNKKNKSNSGIVDSDLKTESIGTKLRKMTKDSKSKEKKTSKPRINRPNIYSSMNKGYSVLLVNAEPSRISLKTLDNVAYLVAK